MKRLLLISAAVCFVLTAMHSLAAEPKPLSDSEKLGYSIGYNIGNNLKRDAVEAPVEQILNGLRDAFQGKDGTLSKEEMQSIVVNYQKIMMAKRAEEMKKAGDRNKQEGETFLAENKKKPGVITTASGLQYQVITQGTGKQPKETDKVKVHYRGTLLNGNEFDSSYKRGEPAFFRSKALLPDGLRFCSL